MTLKFAFALCTGLVVRGSHVPALASRYARVS